MSTPAASWQLAWQVHFTRRWRPWPAEPRLLLALWEQGQARVRRLLASRCGVLWIALPRSNPKPMDGAQVALLDDPAAAGVVIGAAAQRVLRTAP